MAEVSWTGVIIALIGIVCAVLSGRAAKKAADSSANASVLNARTAAETDAYNRARSMDIMTIQRQNDDIAKLVDKIRVLETENNALRDRILVLEGRRRRPHG